MDFQCDVMFIDSFMDDVIYVRDVEVCVERMICYITGCIYYGFENFGLGSLYDDYVGLANANFNVLIVVEFISENRNEQRDHLQIWSRDRWLYLCCYLH